MTTTARTTRLLSALTVIGAFGAAAVLLQAPAAHADADAQALAAKHIVELPRVEIVVRRTAPALQVVELPRVEIVGRRADVAATRIVELPRVEITARRADVAETRIVELPRVEIVARRADNGAATQVVVARADKPV